MTNSAGESSGKSQWNNVLAATGKLMAAIERAVTESGADFESLYGSVRLELADDYSFLDPFSGSFQYSNSVVTVKASTPVNGFVNGISEAMRRVVDKLAQGDQGRRVRERVALEMALVARNNSELLQRSGFREELDRIAGTKVI